MYFNYNYFNPRTLLVSENHWLHVFGEYESISTFTAADRTRSCSGLCFRSRCGRVWFRRTGWTGLFGRRTGGFQTLFTELKLPFHRSLWANIRKHIEQRVSKNRASFKIQPLIHQHLCTEERLTALKQHFSFSLIFKHLEQSLKEAW